MENLFKKHPILSWKKNQRPLLTEYCGYVQKKARNSSKHLSVTYSISLNTNASHFSQQPRLVAALLYYHEKFNSLINTHTLWLNLSSAGQGPVVLLLSCLSLWRNVRTWLTLSRYLGYWGRFRAKPFLCGFQEKKIDCVMEALARENFVSQSIHHFFPRLSFTTVKCWEPCTLQLLEEYHCCLWLPRHSQDSHFPDSRPQPARGCFALFCDMPKSVYKMVETPGK